MILKTTPKLIQPKARTQGRLQYYMITIHKHQVKDIVKKNELEAVLYVLQFTFPNLIVINKAYETSGLYGQLHLHLVVRTPPIHYSNLSKLQGFRIRYDRLYTRTDVHQAQQYIAKDQYHKLAQALLA